LLYEDLRIPLIPVDLAAHPDRGAGPDHLLGRQREAIPVGAQDADFQRALMWVLESQVNGFPVVENETNPSFHLLNLFHMKGRQSVKWGSCSINLLLCF
jgi:hypothetical protein